MCRFLQAIAAEAAAVAAEAEARRLGGPPPTLRARLNVYLATRAGTLLAQRLSEELYLTITAIQFHFKCIFSAQAKQT